MIEPAQITLRDGQPFSERFADIYHAADGAAEVARVFLEPGGFSDLLGKSQLVRLGELGFGTGLNFIVAAALCRQHGRRMHFVSFEAAPIAPAVFSALAAERAHDNAMYRELAEHYPPLVAGWHRRYLDGGRITLSLYWGDAATGLAEMQPQQKQPFDLWLLDGFAPDRNPQMWTASLFEYIAKLSHRGTCITTFTAAGRVRRGLIAAGFEMRRVDQRPHKRESLAGHYQGSQPATWTPPPQVSVVGAGIAGCSLARHLAQAGIEVRVFEKNATAAAGASSIPITVLHPRLLADTSVHADFRCHSYLYSSHFCSTIAGKDGPAVYRTGALQIPSSNYSAERLAQVAAAYADSGNWLESLESAAASQRAGIALADNALWFPHACTINTPRLCNLLLDHPAIELVTQAALTDWPDGPTVLACGNEACAFDGAQYLELAAVSGQLDVVQPAGTPAKINIPILGNGYLAPADGKLGVGATYEYRDWAPGAARQANLQQLQPADYAWQASYRGVRSVSSDRTPIAGQLTDLDGNGQRDRYVSTGHGSMGTVSSHYGAALVTARITGEFAPMSLAIQQALAPLRFRQRQARRGYKFGSSA